MKVFIVTKVAGCRALTLQIWTLSPTYFRIDINFYRPTAPGPGPRLSAPVSMCQKFFFTAPNYQSYYFTALLVESISCISVFSKFQTFQLKEDKICNQSHDKVRYSLIKRKCSKLSCFNFFFRKKWVCEIKNRSGRKNYFLLRCYF